MSQQQEPVRWVDESDGLPQGFKLGLSQYRQQGPSDEQVARLRERVVALTDASASSSSGLAPATRSHWLKGLCVLVLVVLPVLWSLRSSQPTPEPTPTASESPSQEVLEPVAPVGPTALEVDAVAAPEPVEETKAPAPRAKASKRAQEAPSANEPVATDPTAELALLTRARRLMTAAPEQALALTREHAGSYPAGVFVEERELIAIEALAQAKRTNDALARGRSFLAAHPRSAHGERVRVILRSLHGDGQAGK